MTHGTNLSGEAGPRTFGESNKTFGERQFGEYAAQLVNRGTLIVEPPKRRRRRGMLR